jgi:hypothetical protein
MEKITTTFDFVGIPEGFYNASAPIFVRLSEFNGSANPYLADVPFPSLLCKQDVKIGWLARTIPMQGIIGESS